jgi:hypothetical protein
MDMRFYWLKDREAQNFFQFHWKPGKNNLADYWYWTKHHAAIHHANIRNQILSKPDVITKLRNRFNRALKALWQGCAKHAHLDPLDVKPIGYHQQ